MKKRISFVLLFALLLTIVIPSIAFAVPVPVGVQVTLAKTDYFVGDYIDLTGATARVVYNDADEPDPFQQTSWQNVDISTVKITPDPATTPLKTGNNDFTLEWTDGMNVVSGSFRVVPDLLLINKTEVLSEPTKKEYKEGEVIDPSGIKVRATFNSGRVEEWTAESGNMYPAEPNAALTPDDKEMIVVFRGTNPSPQFYKFKFPITVTAVTEPTQDPTADPTPTVAPAQEPNEADAEPAQESKNDKKAPKTGDGEVIFPYVLLAIAGILAIYITIKKKHAYK